MQASDGRCPETRKGPKTQGETHPDPGRSAASSEAAKVQGGEPTDTAGEPNSSKQSGKRSRGADVEPPPADLDLQAVLSAWPNLLEPIKAAVLALVKSARP